MGPISVGGLVCLVVNLCIVNSEITPTKPTSLMNKPTSISFTPLSPILILIISSLTLRLGTHWHHLYWNRLVGKK